MNTFDPNTVLAFATTALVIITAWYAVSTARLARIAEEQIRLGKTPNLLFDVRAGLQAWLVNLGEFPVHLQAIAVQKFDRNWAPIDRELVFIQDPSEGNQFYGWKRVVNGPGELEINYALQQLSGKMRWCFYFIYGSTGHTSHGLEVVLDVTSDGVSVRDQQLRLNQGIPHVPTLAELMRPRGAIGDEGVKP